MLRFRRKPNSGEITLALETQLEQILSESRLFQELPEHAPKFALPNWYIAGGCVTQTIWNSLLHLPPLHGLKDIDLVYFNAGHDENDDHQEQLRVQEILQNLPLPVDVINQARVHEWYTKKFGYAIPAYTNTEDGISTWLPTFAIGVRQESRGLKIFAPFGLSFAFEMRLSPNKRQITKDIYSKMAARLKKDWPSIRIDPWDELPLE